MTCRPVPIAALALTLVVAGSYGTRFANAQPAVGSAPMRFQTIDIYVESTEPLAAWQFELTETTGAMTVVGVENGDSEAYRRAPIYDLDAVDTGRADRIIVADYSLSDRRALPTGRTRIATVHVRLSGNAAPDFALNLMAAGNAAGEPIRAVATLELE